MRLLAEHPIVVGLPLAALAAAAVRLGFHGDVALTAVTGIGIFVLVQVFSVRWAGARALADTSKRAGGLADRVERLDSAVTAIQASIQEVLLNSEAKADQRNQRLVREMQMIEGLVAQLARGNTRTAPKEEAAAPRIARPSEPELAPEPVARAIETLSETELLEVIQSALEENRIDLYLQPVVSLPQRKVKFYEGLARLRSLDGEVIDPVQYESLAVAQGFMPIIDNLLLFRCVQIVRRLAAKSARRGVFCRISPHSLVDGDFFPQFLDFMRENAALKDLLVFDLAHETLDLAGTEGEANLEALTALGFSFALRASDDLKLDLAWLRRRNFRFVKVSASVFVNSEREPEAQIVIDNFMTRLERQGIEMIVEDIDSETTVIPVIEHNAPLGAGQLFGGPRPIRRDLLEEGEVADGMPMRREGAQGASRRTY